MLSSGISFDMCLKNISGRLAKHGSERDRNGFRPVGMGSGSGSGRKTFVPPDPSRWRSRSWNRSQSQTSFTSQVFNGSRLRPSVLENFEIFSQSFANLMVLKQSRYSENL
jgi:hypothetical protein